MINERLINFFLIDCNLGLHNVDYLVIMISNLP